MPLLQERKGRYGFLRVALGNSGTSGFGQIEEEAGGDFVSGNERRSAVEDLFLGEEIGLAGRWFGEEDAAGGTALE